MIEMSKRIKNKIGQVFGRLIVIEFMGLNYHYEAQWKCKCECGNEITVLSGQLMAGYIKSCGCLRRESMIKRSTTHGKSKTRIFHIWQGMRARCNNPNNKNYNNYGGRGICVCKEWNKSFEVFNNWAKENGYKPNLSIDRIDVNGNYEPFNCKWSTVIEQNNNKRKSRKIRANGVIMTVAEISKKTGLKISTISERIRRGDVGEQIIRPVKRGG